MTELRAFFSTKATVHHVVGYEDVTLRDITVHFDPREQGSEPCHTLIRENGKNNWMIGKMWTGPTARNCRCAVSMIS